MQRPFPLPPAQWSVPFFSSRCEYKRRLGELRAWIVPRRGEGTHRRVEMRDSRTSRLPHRTSRGIGPLPRHPATGPARDPAQIFFFSKKANRASAINHSAPMASHGDMPSVSGSPIFP